MDKKKNIPITPDTKIGALLDNYPDLESTLIELAPPFAKLRNPILRKTVARVTTLRQAAIVGGISLAELINSLRKKAGLDDFGQTEESTFDAPDEKPAWFAPDKIIKSFDARQMMEDGLQPMGTVMRELKILETNQIFELVTPFVPAPLIDLGKEQGYKIWSETKEPDPTKTYFFKE